MHLLWRCFCCCFRLALCSFGVTLLVHFRFLPPGTGWSLSLFCALKSQGSENMQQVSQGAPSFCVCMHIIIYICVRAYIHAFIYRFLQDIKPKSNPCFLLEGKAEHHINPTQWLLNWIKFNAAVNTLVQTLAFWPTSSPFMHTGPGVLGPQRRLLHSARRNVFCQVASNQCMKKITCSGSSEPASSLRGTELLPATWELEKGLVTCDLCSKGVYF